ncbi:unnamed protein product [Tuber melanosporum]|uniref:(Perigord truffle) hypothetical protein n=1 Tax=Tuber melanosporum (strain Mel28) TaxID=656061 RepID=D5GLN4_TUBMM|nr:uncharacterized protein GSTUM_00010284001 [Tuber melanosporum]CAZ85427.1 unnamed protein product [Tuber melanosporum]
MVYVELFCAELFCAEFLCAMVLARLRQVWFPFISAPLLPPSRQANPNRGKHALAHPSPWPNHRNTTPKHSFPTSKGEEKRHNHHHNYRNHNYSPT